MSRRVVYAVIVGAGLLMLSACRRANAPEAVTIDTLAHRYGGLMVELGERDLDSLDFYVGNDPGIERLRLQPESIDGLHESAQRLRAALDELGAVSALEEARRDFLRTQIDAMILRTEQLKGKNRSFDEESRVFFGVVAPKDEDAAERRGVRSRIAGMLGDEEHPARAYSRFEERFVVPPERVPAVMDAALRECRAVTLQHMLLPAGEHVEVRYVSHKPWSAFSRYMGGAHSVIQVNMDYPLTLDRVLELACHEGYPGHHVFNMMRDVAVVQGLGREEFRVQPTFSPQSYVSEAAASYAPELALPDAVRLPIERDVLAPLAGLKGGDFERYLKLEGLVDRLHTAEPSIAREYLDGALDWARAADALERETLMEHGEITLLYLNQFRTYMLAYTEGHDRVKALIEGGGADEAERWRRYRGLMMNPVVSLGNGR